jgi:predicted Rossmann fold nucleotide-binding protein DprA/Smf involved in DNA uptake
VDDELISDAENLGRLAAETRRTLISGGAKGIDRAAMQGALLAGGAVAGVMADSLERGALTRDNRELLMDHKLVLISPYDPAAGFNVGHAMQRNKVIYALADAALVVTSDFEKGGTWAGAIEQLEKLRLVPVFVRNDANVGKGNSALLQHGALAWPNPRDHEEFCKVLSEAAKAVASEPKQETLSFVVREQGTPFGTDNTQQPLASVPPAGQTGLPKVTVPPAQVLFGIVREILGQELSEPRSEAEVAELLAVSKPQAKAWLRELVAEGVLEKVAKPARYCAVKTVGRLL